MKNKYKRNFLLFAISETNQLKYALPLLEFINRPSLVICNNETKITTLLPYNIYITTVPKYDNELNSELGLDSSDYGFTYKLEDIYSSLFRKINIEGIVLFGQKSFTEQILMDIGPNFGVELTNISCLAIFQLYKDRLLKGCINNNIDKCLIEMIRYLNMKFPLVYNRTIKKLNLGCGHFIHTNWINVDLFINHPEILCFDISKPYPFPENSFDYIFSEHSIEHLDYLEQKRMLNECFRILKPGGALRITTPNFQFLMDLYNNPNNPTNRRYTQWCFSNFDYSYITYQPDNNELAVHIINKFMRSWGHKYIHTPSSLISLICEIGFINPTVCKPGESQFKEMMNIDCHHLIIPDWANALETIVVEFNKPEK